MKKFVTLAAMLVMLFAASLTVSAEESPKGETTTEESAPATSPKTGDSDIVLYGLGAATVVLAAGAVVIKKREMAV